MSTMAAGYAALLATARADYLANPGSIRQIRDEDGSRIEWSGGDVASTASYEMMASLVASLIETRIPDSEAEPPFPVVAFIYDPADDRWLFWKAPQPASGGGR